MISGLAAIVTAALVLGVLILHERRRRNAGPGVPAVAGWTALAFGIAGALAVLVPLVGNWLAVGGVDQPGVVAPWLLPASMALGLTGLTAGGYAFARRDRSWRVWTGLAAAGLVTGFWLLFLIGEALMPH